MRHNRKRNRRARQAANVRLAETLASVNARRAERLAAIDKRAELSGLAFYGSLDPATLETLRAVPVVIRRRKRPLSE